MIFHAIAFLCGDLLLQQFKQLPSLMLMSVILLLCGLVAYQFHRIRIISISFLLGLLWAYHTAFSQLAWQLPSEIENKNITIGGYIASLPVVSTYQAHFLFAVESLENKKINPTRLIYLSWRDVPHELKVGDKWKLSVRLKRIHGLQNPGGFDYEAYALQAGIRASGYVINRENKLLSHSHRYVINQIRQYLQQKIQLILPTSPTAIWLPALMIGERTNVPQAYWEVLRKTGTNHLMAIAGLHLGIITGLAHQLFFWIWTRFSTLVLLMPAQYVSAILALIIAIIYSALAGFSLPTQRASIMFAIYILMLLSQRKIRAWDGLGFALITVLIINPLTILSESFWLSFGTIALIIFGMSGRLAPTGWWWKWGRMQWVIGIGLIPLTLFFFQACSAASFLANTIAIPWLGFCILPLCFLSVIFIFSSSISSIFLWLADKNLALLWGVLTWFSSLNFAVWTHAIPSIFMLILTIIGVIFLLLPRGFSGKFLGIFFLLPLIFYEPQRPQENEFWLSLLDVGQGLSAVVQTKNHLLIFDAGPKFNDSFDAGENVILPFLGLIYRHQIDALVVSHGDNDHIGGTGALIKNLPIRSIYTSVPEKFSLKNVYFCLAGMRWQWDGVMFSFLYPTPDTLQLTNDSSCVLRIDNGKQSLLLTGDIEKFSEQFLLANQNKYLPSTVMIAPHHGSKTSGEKKFITAVHPQYILYATGYLNRYHFPHDSVMSSYDEIHTAQLNTAKTGEIELQFSNNLNQPVLYRQINQHYWFI
ncbi:MAG: hypothetical protein ACD_46C00203G0008 [uncultured bacterium]|nr:MAG: hypothetical protein ACD_46C00203G0008 [uncultured bacterium]